VRPRGDVVDPPEALESDLLMFEMLVAYKEFSEHRPLLSGCIPYARFVIVIVGFNNAQKEASPHQQSSLSQILNDVILVKATYDK